MGAYYPRESLSRKEGRKEASKALKRKERLNQLSVVCVCVCVSDIKLQRMLPRERERGGGWIGVFGSRHGRMAELSNWNITPPWQTERELKGRDDYPLPARQHSSE